MFKKGELLEVQKTSLAYAHLYKKGDILLVLKCYSKTDAVWVYNQRTTHKHWIDKKSVKDARIQKS